MKKIFGFFIDRPLIVNLMMVMILLAGFNTVRTAKIQGATEVEFGIFTISTIRAGASPEKMELSITVPLEEEILEVENVKRVISNSMEGMSIIQVNADSKATPKQLAKIEADLQKAIDRSMSRLPADILEKPSLKAITGADRSIFTLMVTGGASEQVLRRVARTLQSQIREIPNVANVERSAYRDREVRIMLDPQKMARLAVTHKEIERAINSRNVTETGGSLESFVGEQDVVAIGEFDHPKDVEAVIIRASENGDYLRLRDMAEVVLDYQDSQQLYFIDGQPGIMLDIKGKSAVNEFKLVDGVKAVIEKVKPTLPANVDIKVVSDGSNITRKIMGSLLDNAAIGGFLIAVILLLFFPWRAMFWVVAGLPIAVLFGLVAMQMLGIVISATAMVAMIMMLGLLVDDAIVASESIYSHYEKGAEPKKAALLGINDVARPVFTGALTTVIAMLPLLLVGGIDSKFLWVLPATVVLMVIGSLFECMLLLPSHIADSLKRANSDKPKAVWFAWLEARYRGWLNYYLRRPFLSLSLLVLLLFFMLLILSRSANFEPYPEVDTDKIFVTAEMPTTASMDDTHKALADVERRIKASSLKEFISKSYIAVGDHDTGELNYLIEGRQKSWGKVVIELTPFNERTTTAMDIARSFRDSVKDVEGFLHLSIVPVAEQPPSGHPVELQVIMDGDERELIAESLLAFLDQHPAVTQSWSNYSPGKSLIELKINHERLADYGLKVADITKALQLAYDGFIVEELQTREELIRYRLQLQDQYRNNINALRSLNIISDNGDVIPLRNLASFEINQGRFSIPHYAGLRAETLFAEIDRDQISPVAINQALDQYIQDNDFYQRYPGVMFRFGGELESQAETAETMGGGLILVLAGIFFVMVVLFNSLSLPIATLMLVPVSFISVLVVFVIHDLTIGVAATVGLLGLVGVLVNGALVMIDVILRLHRDRGVEHKFIAVEDIINGAVMRLRPLLITAITTLVGLGPAAYGVAGTHPTTEALLLVMFWGVAVGAFVTLFTLPLFLVVDSRCKQYIAHLKRIA